jgi:hypothetical protein
VKVARKEVHNVLLKNEARILRAFDHEDVVAASARPFLPELIDSFMYRHKSVNRQTNAMVALEGFYTLEEVIAAYPDGLFWRDMVWMLRRMLVAVGFAHSNGYVHGAVLPPHVLIHPEEHGLVLCDWTCAVEDGEKVRLVLSRYRGWYPAEVTGKEPVGPETDIFMVMRCAVFLLGGDPLTGALPERAPARLRAFIRGCSQERMSRRPDDAWKLLEELDEILGRRKFRPFTMPGAPAVAAT